MGFTPSQKEVEQQALPPPAPLHKDLKGFFNMMWKGVGWWDVPVCTPEYFKPFASCEEVLWISSDKEDLNVKVVSTWTTELRARWSGEESVWPHSYIWKEQEQVSKLEGRQCFEVKNKEISKLKGFALVVYHVVGSIQFPSLWPGIQGSLPCVPCRGCQQRASQVHCFQPQVSLITRAAVDL